jgi:hypothetical protein
MPAAEHPASRIPYSEGPLQGTPMSSTLGPVGCRPTLDSGKVLALASEVGALQTEGAKPYDDKTCGVLQSAGRTR